MTRRGALGLVMLLGSAGALQAAETFVGTVALAEATRPLTVTIREYTSDDRAFALAEKLHKEGQVAAVEEIAKGDLGTVQVGRESMRATLVRQEKTANGRLVRIVTERPLRPGEDKGAPAPPDTVGYVELELDASGSGSGRLLTAVKATFDKEGYVVPESLGETWKVTVKPGL